jgi:hypothetical protein
LERYAIDDIVWAIDAGLWVFDAGRVLMTREGFVSGASASRI